jgi:phosphatidylinositol phospholipase C delta
MGEGWYYDFHHTHFDAYSPPDFYVRVSGYNLLVSFSSLHE